MFDVGFWELILIFGVGLMILGPERMPRVASQIGRWVGRARRTASQLRRQLQRELELDDFMNQRRPPRPPTGGVAKKPAKDHTDSTDDDALEEAPDADGAAPAETGSAPGVSRASADQKEAVDETRDEENQIATPEQIPEPRRGEVSQAPAKSE